jgi:Tol biopolymer transport system component
LDGRFIFGLLQSEEQFDRGQIVTIEVKTGKLTQLSEPTGMAIYSPEFNLPLSPDGKTLAYTDELGNIFTVRLESGPPVQISEDLTGISQLQWSPNGKQLVGQCMRQRHGDNIPGDICIVNADGSNLRVLTESTEKTAFSSPSWQPLVGQ